MLPLTFFLIVFDPSTSHREHEAAPREVLGMPPSTALRTTSPLPADAHPRGPLPFVLTPRTHGPGRAVGSHRAPLTHTMGEGFAPSLLPSCCPSPPAPPAPRNPGSLRGEHSTFHDVLPAGGLRRGRTIFRIYGRKGVGGRMEVCRSLSAPKRNAPCPRPRQKVGGVQKWGGALQGVAWEGARLSWGWGWHLKEENSKMKPAAPQISWRDPGGGRCPLTRGKLRFRKGFGQDQGHRRGFLWVPPRPSPRDPDPGSRIDLIWRSDLHKFCRLGPLPFRRRVVRDPAGELGEGTHHRSKHETLKFPVVCFLVT